MALSLSVQPLVEVNGSLSVQPLVEVNGSLSLCAAISRG